MLAALAVMIPDPALGNLQPVTDSTPLLTSQGSDGRHNLFG